ncbi:MAG: hypothetical protein GF372_03105 [Candidatus Marinimicrobia bacterium]|nr:hypothetical protein [Candidatus Neomarinimicrobiota bacterium]
MAKNKHVPEHVELEHQVILNAPINRVFRLFTPLEEKKWERDWEPKFLYPKSGKIKEDSLFITEDDGQTTIWMVKIYTTYKHHIAYHRITPDIVAGTVDIKCRPYGEQTSATIKYSFTTLSKDGEAFLQRWTPSYYKSYIEDWRKKINHFLKTGEQLQEE